MLLEISFHGRLPLVWLFSENPDISLKLILEMQKTLDSMEAAREQRYVLTYKAIFAVSEGDVGHVPLPTVDNEMSPETWRTLFGETLIAPDEPGHIRAMFWHSYWWKLSGGAPGEEEEQERKKFCKVQESGDANESTAARIEESGDDFVPLANRNGSFLVLGGDARFFRAMLLLNLFRDGLLNESLWSLQTPNPCCKYHGVSCANDILSQDPEWSFIEKSWDRVWEEMKDFCGQFPKFLDLKLDGGAEDEGKDQMFAPKALYDSTKFSIVFESSSAHDTETFLTEKLLKPIYRGHPFILVCGTRNALAILRSFGFKTFHGMIDEKYDTKQKFRHCTIREKRDSGKVVRSLKKIVELVKRTVQLDKQDWNRVEKVVRFNQWHIRSVSSSASFRSTGTAT